MLTAKLIPIVQSQRGFPEQIIGYRFWCPACQALHPIYIVKAHKDCPLWQFNGDLDKPTFSPSLRMIQENNCHLYVTGGTLSYCNDCKHELRNQTIPMVLFDVERWCPVDTLHTYNGKPVDATATQVPVTTVGNSTVTAAAGATLETHRKNCGDVGNVGPICPSCGVALE